MKVIAQAVTFITNLSESNPSIHLPPSDLRGLCGQLQQVEGSGIGGASSLSFKRWRALLLYLGDEHGGFHFFPSFLYLA